MAEIIYLNTKKNENVDLKSSYISYKTKPTKGLNVVVTQEEKMNMSSTVPV